MTKTHIHCPPGYQVTQVVTEQSYKGTIMILSYLIMKEGSEIALVVFEFGINVFISLFSWKRVEELKLKKKLSGYAEDSILTVSCVKTTCVIFKCISMKTVLEYCNSL